MRWDDLKVDEEQLRTLPGYQEPAAVRTFDAPEALDTRFYEVRAKSILNRVPKRSQMPFSWTINPYRGCSHACAYCLDGETPVLMATGRTKPLAEVSPGDLIFGTKRRGHYRRYAVTNVVDHWHRVREALQVVLEDGTELIASGDHRFLTSRGWKFVEGHRGRGGRPHLTLNTKLMGTGHFASAPDASDGYRRGYLCGLMRGDGCVKAYRDARGGDSEWRRRVARIRLTDMEPLLRARGYLAEAGIAMREYGNYEVRAGRKPSASIQTGIREDIARIEELIAWPRQATPDWCKGLLGGIFDAEGCNSQGTIRIANTDADLIDWIGWCLRQLGFVFVVERTARANGLAYVRLKGGLSEVLRFLHTVDPAITRKRSIEGIAVKSEVPLRVKAINALGPRRLYDITTGTGDFIANGVLSHNCFARPTHTYLGLDAGRDFEKEIVVKVNAPEVLRAELRRPSWKRQHVALGTNTDPYQWVEGRYRLMPGIWEALAESGTPASVLTKSPLLLRDLELMKLVPEIRANLSVPTLDEQAWRATEPHTPHPMKRLEAVAELNRAGIPCGILIAPLMPGVNDSPEQVGRIIELAEEAGAVDIGGIALHLRGEVKELWFEWLREHRPDLLPRYEELYARGAYGPQAERNRLSRLARGSRPSPVARMRGNASASVADRDPAARGEPAPAHETPVEQGTLF